jgi:HAE1 family hydrophobic/amphiphilic exporter-1
VNVRAVFSPGKEIKEKEFSKILKDFAGGNVSIEFAGERAMIKESFRSLCLALLLAVFLIYMIMAAQFESLWQPFIIMLSFPTALIGVAFFLYVRGMSLNIVSLLGIILLGGIAVNNGIVLVSCIDLYRNEMPMEEAVVLGCVRRLRPVLMTTLTTIVALIPISLGIGRGAELEMSMATAVMGGLISSTILTLFVIPAMYIIGAKLMKK